MFNQKVGSKPVMDEIKHSIFQYHKTNVEGLKTELLDFQIHFLVSDPYSTSLEANWSSFSLNQ